MKLGFLVAYCLAGLPVFAAGLVLDGPTFSATGIVIVWRAQTNNLPERLSTFKVVPQEFPAFVVSNVMAVAGFTMKDRTNVEGQPRFTDKRFLYFTNKERTRQLGIFPPLGWLYYRDERARALGRGIVQGVPSETQTLALALQWMEKLGIYQSQFATNRDSSKLQAYRFEQTQEGFNTSPGAPEKETILRGVSFVRQIEGVSLTGLGSDGGLSISFGNEGKIADLELIWRNLKPHKSWAVASPAAMMDRIKQGQAKMLPMGAVDITGAKKLTIDTLVPYYLGEAGDTAQEFVYPFAALQCTLEFNEGSRRPVVLKCPVLADQ